MNRKILTLLITSLILTLQVKADFAYSDGMDFTGEAFFESTVGSYSSNNNKKEHTSSPTVPPLKVLRLNIQNKLDEKAAKKTELAPTMEEPSIYASDKGTSEYASKEVKDEFEEMVPDGFEADEEAVAEKGKKKFLSGKKNKSVNDEDTEDIILDWYYSLNYSLSYYYSLN